MTDRLVEEAFEDLVRFVRRQAFAEAIEACGLVERRAEDLHRDYQAEGAGACVRAVTALMGPPQTAPRQEQEDTIVLLKRELTKRGICLCQTALEDPGPRHLPTCPSSDPNYVPPGWPGA